MKVKVVDISYLRPLDEHSFTLRPWNSSIEQTHDWDSEYADMLARKDFIEPPTGRHFREVLQRLNKSPIDECTFEMITWDTSHVNKNR